jgi:small GTP-binding protein
MNMEKIEIGTCLIGCRTVGKTAFVNRLKDDQFHEQMKETAIPQFLNVLITSEINKYKLKIIDIPGNQIECNHLFIEDNPLLLLFFDLMNFDTFEPIKKYLQLIKNNLRHDRTVILFGTKFDLISNVRKGFIK